MIQRWHSLTLSTLTSEYTTKHTSLNFTALYTSLTQYVGDNYVIRQNSYQLIRVCDWLTTLQPPVVKNSKYQLPRVKRCRSKPPSFLPARTSWRDVIGRVQLKRDDAWWRTGGEVKWKLANGVGSHYPSHYFGTWCIQHYYRWCAHLGCQ